MDEPTEWTQRAVAILTAKLDTDGRGLSTDVLRSYLVDDTTPEEPSDLASRTMLLLSGMTNAAYILLALLEETSGVPRLELLQRVSSVAEALRDD